MPEHDFSILKRNINTLLDQNNLTQAGLADLLGMTQSNVSKCLKPNDDSRRFTLEQVCKIAQHFDISLDELVGLRQKDQDYNSEDICRLFSYLLRKYKLVHIKHSVEEESLLPSRNFDFDTKKMTVEYDAFYFPNYMTPPKYFDEYRLDDWMSQIHFAGNEIPENISINNFLHKFIDAFEKYDSGVYSEDDYNILIDAYYRILKK